MLSSTLLIPPSKASILSLYLRTAIVGSAVAAVTLRTPQDLPKQSIQCMRRWHSQKSNKCQVAQSSTFWQQMPSTFSRLSPSQCRSHSGNSSFGDDPAATSVNRCGDQDDSTLLESLVEKLADSKFQNVVVLLGAGASVSAGIPDFRSPETGLYDRLQKYRLPYPEAIFDLDYYRDNPMAFVDLCGSIWPGQKDGPRPTIAHSFCKMLEEKGILRRIYTQNIDGLETLAGIHTDKLVECHGHFRVASCISCKSPMHIETCRETMVDKVEAPRCTQCGSLVKPDIVFFGEVLPKRFQDLVDRDTSECDLLLVMGTSLMVMPVASIPDLVSPTCPRILLNRELVGAFRKNLSHRSQRRVAEGRFSRDVFLQGDCDDGVRRICQLAGWEEMLDQRFAECR